jgi:hypothetical protein
MGRDDQPVMSRPMSDYDYSPLKEALDKLTVCDVWEILGLDGTPKPSCRSPFRDDRNASFSIYDGGRRWKDHAIGENGDAADFVAKACNLSKEEGARRLIELAGTACKTNNNSPGNYKNARRDAVAGQKQDPFKKEKTAKTKKWPVLEAPTPAEIEAIAELRGLSAKGVSLAVQRGLLYCADSREGRAWTLTDSSRVNAQARRIDGKPWQRKARAKAWTLLPGSVASWPVGLPEATPFPAIALVEGAPDLLASLHLAWCHTATQETIASGKGVDIVETLASSPCSAPRFGFRKTPCRFSLANVSEFFSTRTPAARRPPPDGQLNFKPPAQM